MPERLSGDPVPLKLRVVICEGDIPASLVVVYIISAIKFSCFFCFGSNEFIISLSFAVS